MWGHSGLRAFVKAWRSFGWQYRDSFEKITSISKVVRLASRPLTLTNHMPSKTPTKVQIANFAWRYELKQLLKET